MGGERKSSQPNLDYEICLALKRASALVLVHVVEDIDLNSPFTLGSPPATVE